MVVCGHSHCGAVGALVRGEDLTAVPAVRDWLAHAAPRPGDATAPDDPTVADAVQSHVLAQILRLRSYPCIGPRLEAGELRLHAWFYEIHTGSVLAHQPHADTFVAL